MTYDFTLASPRHAQPYPWPKLTRCPLKDTIKRQARREAWYADSYNPFQQTGRARTWGSVPPSSSVQHAGALADIQTEPNLRTRISGDSAPELRQRLSNPAGKPSGAEETSTPRNLNTIIGVLRRIFGLKEQTDPSLDEENCERKKPWIKTQNHIPFTVRNQIQATILGSWVRLLLLLTPIGFVTHYLKLGPTADFLVNFFAILPLTDMFGQALVEVKTWAGDPRLELVAYVLCGFVHLCLVNT